MRKTPIPVPDPSRQLAFHELLLATRKSSLIDALRDTLSEVDPNVLKQQLNTYVPSDVHVILSRAGIPDEHVLPLPVLIETKPTLVAYYRLLLGLPQKTFYGKGSQMGMFKSMETGSLNKKQRDAIPAFCIAMIQALSELVRQMSPTITNRDVSELPLLTLGQQFQGGNNNTIGQEATRGVFLSLRELLDPYVLGEPSDTSFTVKNDVDDLIAITFAGDPDISIQKNSALGTKNLVAIEIKGGYDKANQHNRIGEAEKSHRKAKGEGYKDFWTLIRTGTLDMDKARIQSPTTSTWFDTAQIIAADGQDWELFRENIAFSIGITLP